MSGETKYGSLDRAGVLRALTQTAELLSGAESPTEEVFVVGGAWMALHGLRDSTTDVDSLTTLSAAVVAAASEVGDLHGLNPKWFNASSRGFRPNLELDSTFCTVGFDHPSLRVWLPHADYVFVMKLEAGRAVDDADLRKLWPLTTFTDADAALELFHEAYPVSRNYDEYLGSWLAKLVARAEATGPPADDQAARDYLGSHPPSIEPKDGATSQRPPAEPPTKRDKAPK